MSHTNFFDIKNKSANATQLVKDETLTEQQKFIQLAQRHGLDPQHMETWPEEVKQQLKEET